MTLLNYVTPPSLVAPSGCCWGGPMTLLKSVQGGPMNLRTGTYLRPPPFPFPTWRHAEPERPR